MLISTPSPASGRDPGPRGFLRVIPGGLNQPALVVVERGAHEELHAEVATARVERLTHATEARHQIRAGLRHLSKRTPDDVPRVGAAAACFIEALRIIEAEATRALAMDTPCPCGAEGPGHGPADSDAIALRVAVAA